MVVIAPMGREAALTSLRDTGGRGAVIPTGSYVSAVTSREVRDLADLGNASRALGARWEEVGGQALVALIGQEQRAPSGESFRCQAVVRLDGQAALLTESSGRGLKSPDCLFAGRDRLGRLVLQPGDFKFTLDVATRDQIDPAPLRALIEGGGPLFNAALATLLAEAGAAELGRENVAVRLLAALDAGQARLLPGFFLAPDEPVNRLFLRQAARRRRGGITEADVRFLPVDLRFFDGLPGAEVAPLLREVDGVPATAPDFPCATYYFQLGAAVRGAFSLLLRPLLPLLGPEPEIDAPQRLRGALARRPAMWAIDVARDLAALAMQRRERIRLAHRLAGSSMRGRPAYEVVEAAGYTIADEPGPAVIGKAELRLLLDRVEAIHSAVLAELINERLAAGPFANDQAVLAWLQAVRPALEERDRAELLRLLAERAAGAPAPE
jgi:hypothetical protein